MLVLPNRRVLSRQRAGNVTALVGVSLAALMGVVGIVIDGGRLVAERRHAQNASDAAAMAAAIDLYNGATTTAARQMALTYAARNGFNNDSTTNTVTVTIPPSSGPYAGDPKFAEVVSKRKLTTYFIQFVYSKSAEPQVRSVAGFGRRPPGSPAVAVLDPKKKRAFIARKGVDLKVENGPIHVNSSHSKEAAIVQDDSTVTATEIKVNGGYAEKKKGDFSPNPVTGVDPLSDPLALLKPPDTAGMPVRSKVDHDSKSALTLSPGVYNGGVKVKGDANVTLQPGIYVMNGGGFKVETKGNLIGNGVFIFNTGSKTGDDDADFNKISFKVDGNLNLSAPTSGDYEGLIIFNDRNNTKEVKINSKSDNQSLNGTIYAPNAKVHIHGKGTLDGSQIISATCRFCADGVITLKYDPSRTAKPTFLSLVE